MVASVTTENSSEVTVDNDYFEVADGNLKLKDGMSLDFEAVEGGMIELTLTASGDGESATATVTVTVNDVNEDPSIDVRDGEAVPDAEGSTEGRPVSSLTIAENAMKGDEGVPPLALIEVMDPDAADADMLKGEAGKAAVSITGEQADKFQVILDPANGLWLHLADDASLDHEEDSEVTVTVTYTDSAGNTASTDVTVMVTDVNEAPVAVGTVDAITTESGEPIKPNAIDLLKLFNDPDAGDASAVRYELSGGPSWLRFAVEFGEDDDGNDTAQGIFTGTPPVTGTESDAAHKVSLTATDSDGAESDPISFYVIVDDGNDDITDVDLIDSNGRVAVEADVDENDASGVVFGEIRVTDRDHKMHPNGMHLIQILKGNPVSSERIKPSAQLDDRFEVKYDDAGIPWLALKAGMSLDEETNDGVVDITIRAVDMNGATNSSGTKFTGNVEFQTVSIVIKDENDAPKANTIGNWWVTAESGQQSDEVSKGEWLTFELEEAGDMPGEGAFWDPDGDDLTYSLRGPAFLEISEDGMITNTKGGEPVRGVHTLTVTATDPDGATVTTSFKLAVALSRDGTNAVAYSDEPRFGTPNEFDYPENSGDRRVATFSVMDDDSDLGHHPFALETVTITQIVVDFQDAGTDDLVIDVAAADSDDDYVSAFQLSQPRKSGDTWTYDLLVKDTNPATSGPSHDTTAILNHETINRVIVTITATDGVGATRTQDIRVVVDPVNEKPTAEDIGTANTHGPYGVNQSEGQKEVLYIKLEDIWSDPENDLNVRSFKADVDGPGIKILQGPDEWGDIDDDVTWNDPPGDQTAVVIGDDATPPALDDWVVIIEIDRTGRNDGQDDDISFTLMASDRRGATGSKTYKVPVTDENLNPTNAVSVSGSAREGATLRATFNDDRDPDLRGDAMPALVLYQWFRGDEANASDATTPFRQSTSNSYTLTQADVNKYITVKVKYYEVGADATTAGTTGQLVGFDTTSTTVLNQATTTRMVTDTPDKGAGSITVLADNNVLSVTDVNVRITDGDYSPALVPDTNLADLTVSWEMSDNGRGGWEPVDEGDDTETATLELDDGKGKYYRAVVSYDANGTRAGTETESIYSDAIQVSDVTDGATTAPTITGNPFPGGTLSVNVRDTSVQWQERIGTDWVDIPGATGSLTLTSAHAGDTVRALVSYRSTDDDNPGVTAIVATDGETIGGGTTGTGATPHAVDDHNIEISVDAPGHAPARTPPADANKAGHNLSHTEIVPLASLFQDPDSASLTYTVAADSASGLGTPTVTGTTYVFDGANSPGGVLVFEASTGKLTYNSDVYQGHDNSGTPADDGAGNVITLNITATDPDGNSSSSNSDTDAQTAAVNVRINVAPTGINFNNAADGTGTTAAAINIDELPGRAPPGGMFIARVDVQDQNSETHKFGTHTVTVDDDRFMITHTHTNAANGTRTDDDKDGSTWEVRLKPGAMLDYEVENADRDPTIVLTLTATDSEGLATPAPVKLTITVTDVTRANGDVTEPPAATPTDVPGLMDDETTDPDEREDDENGSSNDGDTDGGAPPPPPGGSLGGIIEDFVDNMDTFEQDLLEDFMLVIDDGLDIA